MSRENDLDRSAARSSARPCAGGRVISAVLVLAAGLVLWWGPAAASATSATPTPTGSAAVPDVPVPQSPSGAIVDTTPEFRWTAVPGASKYFAAVYDVTAGAYVILRTVVEATAYTPSTPLDGTHAYRWKVRAGDGVGWSAYSRWMPFDYLSGPPPVPDPLSPSRTIADTTPDFQWTAVAGASKYLVAVYDVTAGAYAILRTVVGATTYTPSTPLDGTHAYRWKVRAGNGAAWSSYSRWMPFDYLSGPLPVPGPLIPSGTIADTMPDFQWTMVAGASKYLVAVYDVTAGAYATIRTVVGAPAYTLAPPLNTAHAYKWKVRAHSGSVWSAYSGWLHFDYAQTTISNYSLRFYGNGSADIDRVKIPIDDPGNGDPGPPADVGATDFTLEFWMKAAADDNMAGAVSCGNNINWIYGNIVVDRDRFSQDRKFGLSIAGRRLAFGVSGDGTGDRTICGTSDVLDGQWHHVAVQRRRSDGHLWLYVGGVLEDDADGPAGDVSYPDDGTPCGTCCGGDPCDFSDPFLVIGAEKHDAGNQAFPSYSGFVDEFRLSNTLRYAGASFPSPPAPFAVDADTVALYHFEEGNGDGIHDAAAAAGGPSDAVRKFGGAPAGPEWTTDTPFPSSPSATLAPIAPGLDRPVAITHAGDARLFIVLQGGRVVIHDGTQVLPTPFLDMDALVSSSGERGLLSMAFHPQYAENGFFFVNYTDNAGDTVIARYRRSAQDPDQADGSSGVILLTIEQPFANHNGGQLQFGPGGYLYIGMGDGGGGGDPDCYAQRDDTLLGKMLRIDVDQSAGAPPYYAIPPDNPSIDGNPVSEVWAKGLRNPWRFSFDRLTGGLLIADVGQGAHEEVSYQPSTSGGGENYGWKIMEGIACFGTGGCPPGLPPCNSSQLIEPIIDYAHSSGNCSVTGGYVYRGSLAPQLYGVYLYADYCTGRIWGARQNGSSWGVDELTATGNVTAFGEDAAGEVYVAASGTIYHLR